MKKTRPFDEAIRELGQLAGAYEHYSKTLIGTPGEKGASAQSARELRAAVRVLKECGKATVVQAESGVRWVEDEGHALATAILKARKLEEK
jgi:hypothetical protein